MRILFALLVLVSFCLSLYVGSVPGPVERRLIGCWTTTYPDRWPDDEHLVFMQLKRDGDWTTWWRRGDRPWQVGGTGRWSFDGEAITLRFANEDDRSLIEALRGEDTEERRIVLESAPNRLVTRSTHSYQNYESTWQRTSEKSLPQTDDSARANP